MIHNWFVMGARNLRKNSRRSLFTIGAVAIGFAAVNLFGGFTRYVFGSMEDAYVYAYGNGHLTIFKQGFLKSGSIHPERFLLNTNDLATLETFLRDDPRVACFTPQLNFAGLLSNGRVSTIALAEGRDCAATRRIRAMSRTFMGTVKSFEGAELRDDAVTPQIGASRGLAAKMDLTNSSDAILMGVTVDGQPNAMDVQVVQLFDAPVEALDEMMMTAPLSLVRKLYDTEGADRLLVVLRDPGQMQALRATWQRELARRGLPVEIRTWEELRISYFKIRDMFRVIFSFLFVIVVVIVVLSVVNTIGMSVMERTREIGTLRALGMKRRGIIAIFAIESALLGMAGSLVGVALTLAAVLAMRIAKPTWIPPNISMRLPLEIWIVPEYMALSFVSLCLLAMLVAVIPARHAARLPIIDSLGHV